MAHKHTKEEAAVGPPVLTAAGSWNLETITVGCKVYIERKDGDGELEQRLAEVLSIRDKPTSIYSSRRIKAEQGLKAEDKLEFFVHWDQFNKRLDEWVAASRVILTRELEWPRPKAPPQKKVNGKAPPPAKASRKHPKNKASKGKVPNESSAPSPSPAPAVASPGPSRRKSLPRDEEEEEEGDEDAEGEIDDAMEVTNDVPTAPPPPLDSFSKEQELEKLRTGGSMTQSVSEIARVKNLNRLQIGKHEVEAWYFSPYPREYAHLDILYICEFCLNYFPSPFMLKRHRTRCTLLHPPGNEIYRHEDISFWEIDGKKQLTWCRNLSLLSKCFLDHKTLYFDVTPFLYYVMTQQDSSGAHIIGYFSKEKESADNYNVACILTLPQHQRHGYGKSLIEFSYELSKKEGKLGSPEKPLSDLGLLSYRAYWAETIVELLMNSEDEEISLDEIAQRTSITHQDVNYTCATLQLIKHYKGSHVLALSDSVIEQYEKARAKRKRRIHPEKLLWKPPVFTRDQLRFGW